MGCTGLGFLPETASQPGCGLCLVLQFGSIEVYGVERNTRHNLWTRVALLL